MKSFESSAVAADVTTLVEENRLPAALPVSGARYVQVVDASGAVVSASATADRLTSIGHSRKLHALIPGSTLLECEKAGHMVIMERHDQVNAELDQLIAAAAGLVDSR